MFESHFLKFKNYLQLLKYKILSYLKTEFETVFGLEFGPEFRHDFELYFDY